MDIDAPSFASAGDIIFTAGKPTVAVYDIVTDRIVLREVDPTVAHALAPEKFRLARHNARQVADG